MARRGEQAMLRWGGRPPEAPVLDEEFLGRLERHIGPEMVRELLADGLIELTDRLERVAALAAEGERREVLRLGHDIAGFAGHIGLSALSRRAVAMNRAAREDPSRPIAGLAEPLVAAGPEAIDALRRRLAEG